VPLPIAQVRVLRLIADTGPATARQVTRGLRLERVITQNALRLLTDKGLVTADHFTVPVSYKITSAGHLALAAGGGES
jgi:DNA-binding transcriptional ArsR family regulator